MSEGKGIEQPKLFQPEPIQKEGAKPDSKSTSSGKIIPRPSLDDDRPGDVYRAIEALKRKKSRRNLFRFQS